MNIYANCWLDDQTIFQDEYCKIVRLTAIPCICQHFVRSPADKGYLKNTLQMILELAQKELALGRRMYYLIEVYEGKLLPSDDVTWIRKDFIPQLVASGICYVAYVSKNNVFSQFVMETLLEGKNPDKVTIRVFQEIDIALEWLAHLSPGDHEVNHASKGN